MIGNDPKYVYQFVLLFYFIEYRFYWWENSNQSHFIHTPPAEHPATLMEEGEVDIKKTLTVYSDNDAIMHWCCVLGNQSPTNWQCPWPHDGMSQSRISSHPVKRGPIKSQCPITSFELTYIVNLANAVGDRMRNRNAAAAAEHKVLALHDSKDKYVAIKYSVMPFLLTFCKSTQKSYYTAGIESTTKPAGCLGELGNKNWFAGIILFSPPINLGLTCFCGICLL